MNPNIGKAKRYSVEESREIKKSIKQMVKDGGTNINISKALNAQGWKTPDHKKINEGFVANQKSMINRKRRSKAKKRAKKVTKKNKMAICGSSIESPLPTLFKAYENQTVSVDTLKTLVLDKKLDDKKCRLILKSYLFT